MKNQEPTPKKPLRELSEEELELVQGGLKISLGDYTCPDGMKVRSPEDCLEQAFLR